MEYQPSPVELSGQDYINSLPPEEKARLVEGTREMVKLAQSHAIPILISTPPSAPSRVNNASGVVLQLGERRCLLTADHVIAAFEERRAKEPRVRWQIGNLIIEDPLSRILWRNPRLDVAVLALRVTEVPVIPATPTSPSGGWPPPTLSKGDFVLVSGYPAFVRKLTGNEEATFNALSALFEVTTIGEDYFICQWRREDLVSFDGPGVPPQSTELGGMSGGPAFFVRKLDFPLVGIVSQFESNYELLRIARLTGLPNSFDDAYSKITFDMSR